MAPKSTSLDLPAFITAATATAKATQRDHLPDATPTASVSYAVKQSASAEQAALPLLPRAQRPSFSSHRNDANAALALDLLADVQGAIVGWHQALRDILLEIQALYMSGPIVDGWLESTNRQTNQTALDEHAAILRHGDPEQVAAYVEKLAQQAQADATTQGTQYRLCTLDAEGQMQCEDCPPDQLGVISQAIARNQKLRQLVSQKQYLEAKLKRAAEALEVTRKALDIRHDPGSAAS
ncbi:hypothetical protein [Leptolyngbya iicbica]|uniref:Uncharacterized protein n=2 Tax=Cyanophyceae TaxID=3028117 RepID=A0A4Q7E3A8_9CYAN|nr:hypothetical protein [Leptolyngbya sp. LK]RZM77146.1 hypothetical protein DYY88_15965 [Leptolyngbya sp. LK]